MTQSRQGKQVEAVVGPDCWVDSCGGGGGREGANQSDKPHWWGWGTQLIILVSPKEKKSAMVNLSDLAE